MSRLFRSPAFAILTGILGLVILWALIRVVVKDMAVRREIRALEREIATLEADQLKSKELLDFIKTNEFLEEEARVRLGLKKPGEKVIVIGETGSAVAVSSTPRLEEESARSNARTWWRYFFGARAPARDSRKGGG